MYHLIDIFALFFFIICLVDSCVPGDMVTITGIVKVTGTEEREYKLLSVCCSRIYLLWSNFIFGLIFLNPFDFEFLLSHTHDDYLKWQKIKFKLVKKNLKPKTPRPPIWI